VISFDRHVTQRGNFTVEFALVSVFFALLLAFSGDIIMKLAIKGKLDRMAFSAASIIKERKQLFDDSYDLTTDEGNKAFQIVENSLKRTMGSFDENKFGFVLTAYSYSTGAIVAKTSIVRPEGGSVLCSIKEPTTDMFVTTSWGRTLTLYQVTLCYQTGNWYGHLIGKTFNRVQSYSVVMGR
jgi:tight adherence protein F